MSLDKKHLEQLYNGPLKPTGSEDDPEAKLASQVCPCSFRRNKSGLYERDSICPKHNLAWKIRANLIGQDTLTRADMISDQLLLDALCRLAAGAVSDSKAIPRRSKGGLVLIELARPGHASQWVKISDSWLAVFKNAGGVPSDSAFEEARAILGSGGSVWIDELGQAWPRDAGEI